MVEEISGIEDKMKEYIHNFKDKLQLDYTLSGLNEVKIDLKKMDKYDPDLVDYFSGDPSGFVDKFKNKLPFCEEEANITPVNPPEYLFNTIEDIEAGNMNKLVVLEGNVRKKYNRNMQIVASKFKCTSCENVIKYKQSGRKLQRPVKCKCGGKNITELKKQREYKNIANIIVEATIKQSSSTIPQNISMELGGHLASPGKYSTFSAGDRVQIIGIVRPTKIKKKSRRRKAYIQILNISPTKEEFEKMDISDEEIEEIKEMSEQEDILTKFAQSIAPEIHGRSDIKKATALQLFGGVQKGDVDKGNYHRGDIHILLIGDPGTSKSKILSYISGLAPKSRYLSGGSVTSSGLTSTAMKDDETWTLEAGSMSLTNKGVLCLDEIDALDESELKRLNEAMERQTISVSKASIDSTLETKTTVLAAGNPKLDRFDMYKPMSEQITIPDTLLSRFDLIFPLKDVPDEKQDKNVVENIFEGSEEVLTEDIIKKYVAYARGEVEPEMAAKAKSKVKEFYVGMRSKSSNEENSAVPLTARQIHSMRRLAEASARMRLSDKVEERDADIALDLVKTYMEKVGIDPETGEYDIDVLEGRNSQSKRNKMRSVVDIVSDLSDELGGNAVPTEDVKAGAEEEGISDPEEIINELKKQGELFEPKNGHIKVL